MKKESKNIAIACFLGGVIGAFLALEIASYFSWGKYLWFIGAIIGGGISYLTYDLKEVGRGVKQAWRTTISYRPNWARWKEILTFSGLAGAAGFSTSYCLVLFWVAVEVVFKGDKFFMTPMIFIIAFFSLLSGYAGLVLSANEENYMIDKKKLKLFVIWFNPLMVTFYWPAFGLWWVLRHLPFYLIQTVKFAKITAKTAVLLVCRVFIYIHSYERVLCLSDAALGAAIGFFASSAIIGGLTGALIGVLNYEIVSVRLLHLKPMAVKTE